MERLRSDSSTGSRTWRPGGCPELRADVEQLRADFERLPHLATKADMERGFRQVTSLLAPC